MSVDPFAINAVAKALFARLLEPFDAALDVPRHHRGTCPAWWDRTLTLPGKLLGQAGRPWVTQLRAHLGTSRRQPPRLCLE